MSSEPRSQWDDDFAEVMRTVGYDVYEPIDRGETADTFLAYQTRLDRQVALKRMLPHLAADSVLRKRFIQESRAAAAVGHDHIIPIYDVGEVRGMVYVAIRYTSGGDVGALLRRETADGMQLPARRVAELVRQVASALDAAHSMGLLHRNVRPENMVLEADMGTEVADHVYLSNFGLSQRSLHAAELSGDFEIDGTDGYVAPEQLAGRPVAGSDQFSLGCSAFEMLTGLTPFGDVASPLAGRSPLATPWRRDLDYEVDAVFAKVLSSTPAERYADCGEFADHLAAMLGVGSTPAPDLRRGLAQPVGFAWGFDPDQPPDQLPVQRQSIAAYQRAIARRPARAMPSYHARRRQRRRSRAPIWFTVVAAAVVAGCALAATTPWVDRLATAPDQLGNPPPGSRQPITIPATTSPTANRSPIARSSASRSPISTSPRARSSPIVKPPPVSPSPIPTSPSTTPSPTPKTTRAPHPSCDRNLALRKPVTASGYTQVYVSDNAVDGNTNTYWESTDNAFPQWFQVDLGSAANIGKIVMYLPLSPLWLTRTQTLSISGSKDGKAYIPIVRSRGYTFPGTSEKASVVFRPVTVRYVKLTFTANTDWPAGQLSELRIYRGGSACGG